MERLDKFLCDCGVGTRSQVKAILKTGAVTVDGAESAAVHTNARKLDGEVVRFYLANLTADEQVTRIALPRHCRVWAVDLLNGTRTPLATHFEGENTVIDHTFAVYGDLLLETAPAAEETVISPVETVVLPLSEKMLVSDMTDNGLTLDYCRWRVDGGEWQPAAPTLYVQRECIRIGHRCEVTMAFDFTVEDLGGIKTMALAAECPDTYRFEINGQPYTFRDQGYYIDKSFRCSDIYSLLREGVNTIEMTTTFTQSEHTYNLYANPNVHESEWNRLTVQSELESVYLVGRFGVNAPVTAYGEYRTVHTGHAFTLGSLPTTVWVKNLTEQGLWFFAGAATLTETIAVDKRDDVRYEVRLSKLYAPAARVFVNGHDAGELAFAPYVLDVTAWVKDGDNTVEIRLYSGLRNALGPHHLPAGDFFVTSPGNFTQFDKEDRDNRGLGWTEDYRSVLFGFEQ